MKSPVKVIVTWTDEKITSGLPVSNNYITVAKFSEEHKSCPDEMWSVKLEFIPNEASNRTFEADAEFLMPNGPWSKLSSGCVFELYEGNKKTATVEVVSNV